MDCNDLVAQYDPSTVPKTNLEKWLQYLRYVESPNSYIVMAFYSAIGSALQRRVFKYHGDVKCYPNDFYVLVGRASIGKGRVIRPYKALFHGFTYDRECFAYDEYGKETRPSKFKDMASEVESDENQILLREAKAMLEDSRSNTLIDDLLFPSPADSSSLRALTNYLANSTRSIRYFEPSPSGEPRKMAYLHSSAMLILEEIVSLFKDRKETKDIVDFLVQTWDAGRYRHATMGYGIDNIENCCISMLAGTTPDTMEELFTQRLLREGLSSRTIFVYEEELRFKRYPDNSDLMEMQRTALRDLRIHIKHLSHVFGRVVFSPEAEAYLKQWYEVEDTPNSRANRNNKLEGYYGRKLAHIIKLSLAIHFSEKLDRFVTLSEVKLAMELLNSIEVNMHKALKLSGRNDAFSVHKKIYDCIKKHGPIASTSILLEFMEDLKSIQELDEILNTMIKVGSIEKVGNKYKVTQKGQLVA